MTLPKRANSPGRRYYLKFIIETLLIILLVFFALPIKGKDIMAGKPYYITIFGVVKGSPSAILLFIVSSLACGAIYFCARTGIIRFKA